MTEKVPGCYVIIGNGESSSSLRNPNYDFNDDALVYGAVFRSGSGTGTAE